MSAAAIGTIDATTLGQFTGQSGAKPRRMLAQAARRNSLSICFAEMCCLREH